MRGWTTLIWPVYGSRAQRDRAGEVLGITDQLCLASWTESTPCRHGHLEDCWRPGRSATCASSSAKRRQRYSKPDVPAVAPSRPPSVATSSPETSLSSSRTMNRGSNGAAQAGASTMRSACVTPSCASDSVPADRSPWKSSPRSPSAFGRGRSRQLVSRAASLAGPDESPVLDEAVEKRKRFDPIEAGGGADVAVGDRAGFREVQDDAGQLLG